MALITCPECGKEISDKAVSCPGCGCPIQSSPADNRTDLEKLVDEIYEHNKDRIKAIKELRENTGMDLKTAKSIMDLKYTGMTQRETNAKLKQKLKEERKQNKEDLKNAFQTLASVTSNSKIPKCPRCKSTSISYTTKKLSLGRTAVGAAVAGAPGAVIGGLSSKKGYAVCLNCGKKWKI